jgi:putative ABC transport system ATP-binding protein
MQDEFHILARGLTRAFPEAGRAHRVLEAVELQIQQGELVALLGPSGSGKSTLLNLISGLDMPDAGEIWVSGLPVNRLGERDRTLFRRRHVGFVYQFFNLLPTLSVVENILLPLELNGLDDEAGCLRARRLLERVGLHGTEERFPDTLSGGEQQRVAIVRALVHQPGLLLADEPTGNLDEATGEQVLDVLLGLVRQHGVTMLVATHSRRVASMCDRSLVLHQGKLAPVTAG